MTPQDVRRFKSAVTKLRREERHTSGNESGGGAGGEACTSRKKPIKISECDDFAWPRRLWRAQSRRLGWLVAGMCCSYAAAGYFLLGHRDGNKGLDGACECSIRIGRSYFFFFIYHSLMRLLV